MRFVLVAAAVFGLAGALPVFAQTGPAELPPADFAGQQYVDSQGCVFLRAGFGGQIQWIQRITADRQPLCGYPPTFGAATAEVAEVAAVPAAEPAQAPAPKKAQSAKPPAPANEPELASPAESVTKAAEPAQNGPGPGKIGCYKSAPVPIVVDLRGGGKAIVCTTGDGTLTGWRSPIFPAGVGAAHALPDGYDLIQEGTTPATSHNASPAVPEPEVSSAAGFYVQVGTYAVAANADGTAVAVQALGLIAGRSNVTMGGRALQGILAGPFAARPDAIAALAKVKAAGYGDAFIR